MPTLVSLDNQPCGCMWPRDKEFVNVCCLAYYDGLNWKLEWPYPSSYEGGAASSDYDSPKRIYNLKGFGIKYKVFQLETFIEQKKHNITSKQTKIFITMFLLLQAN